ncbi:uncharacterized protein PAC_01105 [Phialocephala subalpina]|uniref:Uncharacterized protein n=1 Tax=Phialocephala subalpina TaxID=576137 RepID=A0A1L7WEL7_9HELO|nr:uncharacterized protein PAC_01105 [Phialocephala subalpina]
MDSPSRPRKRGFEDQLDNQIENSEPGNTQQSKASLECILEPIPADDPKPRNRKRSVMAGQPHQEEELSGTVAHESVGGGGNHALQDYQMQIMMLDNKLMAKTALEKQDTALRTITSLPDQLNIAHTSVKELLENLPAYIQDIQDFKRSIPRDIEALQGYEEKLDQKEAQFKALENRYNELIQMTPEAQQGELRQVRDKAMLTMQQDREKLRLNRDNTVKEVEGKNERIEGLGVALGRSRELVPELILDLLKLAPKLRDWANGQF